MTKDQIMTFSNMTGEILDTPTEEKREEHDGSFIVVRLYQDKTGWYYSVQLKLKSLIRNKPCLKTDAPIGFKMDALLQAERTVYSWMTKKQRRNFSRFTIFELQQPSLFPDL